MVWVTVGHGSHRNSGQHFLNLTKNIILRLSDKTIKVLLIFFFRFSSDPGDNDCLIEMVILYRKNLK